MSARSVPLHGIAAATVATLLSVIAPAVASAATLTAPRSAPAVAAIDARAVAGDAAATPAIEIGPDGRTIARADAAIAAPIAASRGDAELPFGDAPDWQNTLRIQVGGLAFGDLNGDGRPDLAAVCYQSSSFPPYEDWRNFVYFNDGSGLAAEAGWISADQVHSGDAAIADIDSDGHNDLVVANGGSAYAPNSIYFGSATGLATTPGWQSAQPAWAVGMKLVDIDGDGDLDLVTANQGRSAPDVHRPAYLFRNDDGQLTTTPVWQSAEASIQNSVATGDLDGDGRPEIGLARWVGFTSGVHVNAGTLPAPTPALTFGSGQGDRGIAFADMDGDGDLDVVIGLDDRLHLFLNDGVGGFTDAWTSGRDSNHQDLLVADVDGDGLPDIVEIDFSTGRADLYRNRPGLPAALPDWSYDAAASGTALAAADLDGDGRLDLAIGYSGQPSVVVFFNRLSVEDRLFADGFEPEVLR